MIFYKTVPVKIKRKMIHNRKIGGKIYNSIITDYGEIPSVRYNEKTKKWGCS